MPKKTRHFNKQILVYVSTILIVTGLDIIVIAIWLDKVLSPWFIATSIAIVTTLISIGLQQARWFTGATYVLLFALISLAIGMLLQFYAALGFAAFIFGAIIIVAGLLLGPRPVVVVSLLSMVIPTVIIMLNAQLTLVNLSSLFPAFGMIILTAFLILKKEYLQLKLDRRLARKRRRIARMPQPPQPQEKMRQESPVAVQAGSKVGWITVYDAREFDVSASTRPNRIVKGTPVSTR